MARKAICSFSFHSDFFHSLPEPSNQNIFHRLSFGDPPSLFCAYYRTSKSRSCSRQPELILPIRMYNSSSEGRLRRGHHVRPERGQIPTRARRASHRQAASFSLLDRRLSCCLFTARSARLYNHVLGSEWNCK